MVLLASVLNDYASYTPCLSLCSSEMKMYQ